jgi:hypothetical protein
MDQARKKNSKEEMDKVVALSLVGNTVVKSQGGEMKWNRAAVAEIELRKKN